MVLRQPGEERALLLDVGARGQLAAAAERLGAIRQALEHGAPIRDRGAHVVEHAAHTVGQRRRAGGIERPRQAQLHDRLGGAVTKTGALALGVARDLDHRMRDHLDRQAVALQRGDHRVDQERHVVVDRLGDDVARGPAVGRLGRVEDAHQGAAGLPLGGEVPHALGARDQLVERQAREVARRHPGIELAREGFRRLGHGVGDAVDQAAVGDGQHGRAPWSGSLGLALAPNFLGHRSPAGLRL